MARTGYKIVTYLDDNPYSPTYMETYEVREYDTSTCPLGNENLVLIDDQCEIVLTGYTGYRIRIYYNTLTQEYIHERTLDPECEESSTDEIWIDEGEPYCETDSRGINTGYMIQIQRQINPTLPNYDERRELRYKSPDCGENACPIWEEVSRSCHIAVVNCVATFDGTADVVQIDTNQLSDSYNRTRTINVKDDDCDNCTSTTFSWVDVGDVCGDDEIICENGITEDNGSNINE